MAARPNVVHLLITAVIIELVSKSGADRASFCCHRNVIMEIAIAINKLSTTVALHARYRTAQMAQLPMLLGTASVAMFWSVHHLLGCRERQDYVVKRD